MFIDFRGRKVEREGHSCETEHPFIPNWGLNPQPNMCPDWESNPQGFGYRMMFQPTEPHQPGPQKFYSQNLKISTNPPFPVPLETAIKTNLWDFDEELIPS